jgi:hypothetical protein
VHNGSENRTITSIATMSAQKLPPEARHHVPSSTPMVNSDMDPNVILDIAPTIAHLGVLTVAEANAQFEALAPPQEMKDAAMNKIMLSGRMSRS